MKLKCILVKNVTMLKNKKVKNDSISYEAEGIVNTKPEENVYFKNPQINEMSKSSKIGAESKSSYDEAKYARFLKKPGHEVHLPQKRGLRNNSCRLKLAEYENYVLARERAQGRLVTNDDNESSCNENSKYLQIEDESQKYQNSPFYQSAKNLLLLGSRHLTSEINNVQKFNSMLKQSTRQDTESNKSIQTRKLSGITRKLSARKSKLDTDVKEYASIISSYEKINDRRIRSPIADYRLKAVSQKFPCLPSSFFEKPEWSVKMPHTRSISITNPSNLGNRDNVIDKFDIIMNDTKTLDKMHNIRHNLGKNPLAEMKSKRDCFKCGREDDFFLQKIYKQSEPTI